MNESCEIKKVKKENNTEMHISLKQEVIEQMKKDE